MSIRVLIADDHPMFLEGLASSLDASTDIEVVGQAVDGAQVVDRARELTPDVIVMDLHMPEVNGIDATRRIVTELPSTAVLVLTMFEDEDSVVAAIRAGAKGYVLKGAPRDEIVRAVTAVASGQSIYGPKIGERLAGLVAPRTVRSDAFPELTTREVEVLHLIAAGRNNATIAAVLSISNKTVRNYISNIFAKIGVADRSEAIVKARSFGLGAEP